LELAASINMIVDNGDAQYRISLGPFSADWVPDRDNDDDQSN
jgi:hypothetical protein